MAPAVASARENTDVVAVAMQSEPIAIPLHFEDPAGRGFGVQREARLGPFRDWINW